MDGGAGGTNRNAGRGTSPGATGANPSVDDEWAVVQHHRHQAGRSVPADRRVPVVQSPDAHELMEVSAYLPAAYAPEAANPQGQESGTDFRKYLWMLVKHKWLILGVTMVFVGLSFFATYLATPIYRAAATIKIDRNVASIVNMDGVQPANNGQGGEFYQTQYELLRSRSLAEKVVDAAKLTDDLEFIGTNIPSPLSRVKALLFGGKPDPAVPSVDVRKAIAIGKIMGGLDVAPIGASSVVQLTFDSPNPQVAARIVNAIADGFITANLDRSFEASSYARNFLEEQLAQLKLKLEESERQLVAYAGQQGIIGTGDDDNSFAMTDLTTANTALSQASAERLRLELLLKQIDSVGGLGLPAILESDSIKQMRADKAELQAEYQDKLSFFKPAFPDMLRLKAQIDEISRQIDSEVQLIRQSIQAQFDAAVDQEKALQVQIEQLKGNLVDFRNRNIQYTILQREVDTNRTLYEGLLQRYKEIGVAAVVDTNNVSIVDHATVPGGPYTPNLRSNLMKGLMFGLLFGAFAALAWEYFDDRFKSPEDIEETLGLPLLGIIPQTETVESPAALMEDPRSPASEAYRSLRTALQFSTNSGVPKTLLVTSSRAAEGKSTTALVLAQNFADLGLKVLLIDADLRKPSLHRQMSTSNSSGLSNYLAAGVRPPDLFQETSFANLTFLPTGPLPPNPAELLHGSRMLSLLSVASQKFDLVIIDAPPVAGLADAPLLASMAMGTLLVVEAHGTRRAAVRAALKRLRFARAEMIGVVLNKLDSRKAGYSYGYGYGYSDSYYYGYGTETVEQLAQTSES